MSQEMEFWIIKFSGLPLFHYCTTEEFNPNLISGFFSAIQAFALKMSDDVSFINSLTIGSFNFDILINQIHRLYFISRSNLKMSSKKIQKHLKKLESIFLKKYSFELIGFDGDNSKFINFKNDIEKYYDDNFS